MKLAILTLIVSMTITAAVAQDRSSFMRGEEWQVSDDTAPLDGQRTVTISLLSKNQVHGIAGQSTSAILMLKCSDHYLAAYVMWPGAYFGTHLNEISWRVNDMPVQKEFWEAAYGNYSATTKKNPRHLLDAIEGGGQLVMRVSGYNNTQDIVFDLGESSNPVKSVRAACA
jgi:hypothetical protein